MGSCMWLFLESKAQPFTLMLFKFSRRRNLLDPYQFPKLRLVITPSPVLLLSIHLTQLYQTNSLAPTTSSTPPRIKFVVFPVSIMMVLKHLIRTRLKYFSVFRSCHGPLRTNKCFDSIASEISFLESLSPDLLCLLRHFSVGHFKPAAQVHIGTVQTIRIGTKRPFVNSLFETRMLLS
jgi:hypothetical protein